MKIKTINKLYCCSVIGTCVIGFIITSYSMLTLWTDIDFIHLIPSFICLFIAYGINYHWDKWWEKVNEDRR